jgi:fructose-1,6-bisphosphatase/inositol monophosphatase family enzyme
MSQPFIGETFIAVPGEARYMHGDTVAPLRASGVTSIAEARLFTTTPALFDTAELRAAYDAVENAALQARYGCDCYGYALLAAGHADLVVEAGLNAYDIAALVPIIEESGGAVATWDGERADMGGNIVAAASAELLETTLRLLRI